MRTACALLTLSTDFIRNETASRRRASPAAAATGPLRAKVAVMPVSLPIVERRLDNGLRVVISEDRVTPNVAVCLWYGVGSRHEQPGKTGFAHLFEHVMFQGSANVGKGEHFALIQSAGGTLNGTTSFDRTNYFETMPSHQLALALWLEADRMGGLLAALDQENLDNQRDVVKNERRQSYDNQPYGTAYELLFAMLFPASHPYHHLPIGSMEDLDAASLEDVRSFFTAHYAPDNAVLAIAGDAEEREAMTMVESFFGSIPSRTERAGAPDGTIGALEAPVRAEVHDEDVPAERYTAAYRVPADGSPDIEAMAVAAGILSRGQASRLHKRLRRLRRRARGERGRARRHRGRCRRGAGHPRRRRADLRRDRAGPGAHRAR